MFSLIVFSLVMVAAINENFAKAFLGKDANAGWEVEVSVPKENPVIGFDAELQAEGVDTSQFAGLGRLDYPNEDGNKALSKNGEWLDVPLSGADNGYLDNEELRFQAHATGYDTDEAIIEALKTEPDVMVIDSFSAEDSQAGFGPQTAKFAGVPMEGVFAPATVQIRPASEAPTEMRVIGVIDAAHSMLFGVYLGGPATAQLFPDNSPRPVSYFLNLPESADPGDVANDVELALLPYGASAVDLEQQMEDDQSTQRSFLYVLQGFMGLGLIVGIAAVGVIAFRAVVERRQQIGMLRALGFQRGTVSQAFVIESAIVVVLGVIAGAVFGLILAYILMTSEDFTEGSPDTGGFVVPWTIITVTLTTAVVAALLMAWLPARQASRVVPAEALRYE
jgi:putative ABC transport system permease protein